MMRHMLLRILFNARCGLADLILYYHHHTPNIIKNAFFTELLKNGMSCHHLVMTNSWTNTYKSIYIIECISAHCCLSNII